MKATIFILALLMAGTASAHINSVKVCESDDGALSMLYTVNNSKMTIVAEKLGQKNEQVVPDDLTEVSELSAADLREIQKDFHIEGTLVEATLYGVGPVVFIFAVDSSGEQYVMNNQERRYSSSKYCQ